VAAPARGTELTGGCSDRCVMVLPVPRGCGGDRRSHGGSSAVAVLVRQVAAPLELKSKVPSSSIGDGGGSWVEAMEAVMVAATAMATVAEAGEGDGAQAPPAALAAPAAARVALRTATHVAHTGESAAMHPSG